MGLVPFRQTEVVERQRINYNSAANRHNAQRAINDDQWFVSGVVGLMAVDEPSSKKAFAAYKKLEAAGRKRDYKAFPALATKCEEEVVAYTNGVIRWVNDLIDTAEGTVTVLEHVKTAGQFCGTLAAVTIAAPARIRTRPRRLRGPGTSPISAQAARAVQKGRVPGARGPASEAGA